MELRKRVSYEEFLSWREEKPYREYIHGGVREKSVADDAHGWMSGPMVSAAKWLWS